MGVGGHPGARRRFGGLGGTEVGAEARTRGKLPQREIAGGGGGVASGGVRGGWRARTRAEREMPERRGRGIGGGGG